MFIIKLGPLSILVYPLLAIDHVPRFTVRLASVEILFNLHRRTNSASFLHRFDRYWGECDPSAVELAIPK
jgi:hypothetical protein